MIHSIGVILINRNEFYGKCDLPTVMSEEKYLPKVKVGKSQIQFLNSQNNRKKQQHQTMPVRAGLKDKATLLKLDPNVSSSSIGPACIGFQWKGSTAALARGGNTKAGGV